MAKKRTGRPSIYSDEVATTICDRLMQGESLRAICRDEKMPALATVTGWLAKGEKYASFVEQYARAREIQAEIWADEIVDISDDGANDYMERQTSNGETYEVVNQEHIQRSKLRVDSRKWIASRLLPKKYGDRVSQEVSGPNGGPIETSDRSSTDLAKRLAFLLRQSQES